MTPDEEENFAQPTTSSDRDLNEIVKITDPATNRRQSARVQIDGNTNDVPTSSDQVRVEFKQPVIEGTSGVAQTSESETAAARKSENDKAKSDSDSNVTFKVTSFFLLVIVPLLLLICILLRINFQSIIYMFMLFILPFFYPITYTNLQGNLKRYLIALVTISLLSLLGQLVFQIVLLANQPYGNEKILPNCSFKQEILEEFGYSRYDTAYIGDIFRILVPDVLLLIGCLISLHLCKRVQKLYVAAKREQVYNASAAVAAGVAVVNPILILSKAEGDVASVNKATTTFTDHFCPLENVHASNNEIEAIDGAAEEIVANVSREKTPTPSLSPIRQADISLRPASTFRRALNTALPLSLETTFLLILFCCGSAWPSLATAPYFLASLALLVRWSLAYNIQHTRFQVNIKIGLLLYSALHLLVLYLYQMYLFQTYVAPRQSLVARLLGLTQFVYTRCEQPAHYYINWDTVKWQEICEPTFILALYWFIGVEFAYYGAFITTPATSNAMSLPMRREETGVLSQKTNPTNTDTDTDNDANEKQVILDRARSSSKHTLIYTKKKSSKKKKKRLYNSDINENDLVPAVSVKLRRFRNGSQATNYSNNGSNNRQNNQTTKPRKRRQTAVFFEVTRSYFNMTARFLHKQSYLLSLLSMMTWSILYHSVLTLILLVWACLIWVLPNSRHRCLVTSPWFLFYSTCLLICEFIYGLQLTSSELPEYKEVGLYRHDTPFLHLSVKTFMLLFYCLTMRQFITEKRAQRCLRALGANTSGYETTDTHFNSNLLLNSDMQSQITNLIYGILVKYWIFLSTATLLFMSCQNEVVAYRIGYMALFLYFITVFQLYYTFWRKTLFIFHLIVIIYSMLILLLIYVFQFEEVPAYFKRVFNIDDLVLSSIGFEKFASKDELIVRLLTPMTFLIVNILQIHYFNKPWLDITKVNEQAQYFSPSSVSSSSSQHKNEDQSGANVDGSSNKVESTIVNMESPAIEKTGLEIQSISENPQTVLPSTSGIMKPSTSNLNEIISSNDPVLVVGHRYHHHHHRRHTHPRNEQSARPSTVSTLTTKTEREKFTSFLQRMLNNINWFYSLCCPYLWRIAELHIYKVIVIVIALFCFHKVSVINLILLCSVLFSFVSTQSKRSDRVHTLLSGFVQIWACVFTLASMLYQLKFVESPLVFNCSFAINRTDIDPYLLKPEDNLVYIGVEKSNDILDYLKYYIFILLLLSFQKIIDIKMNFYRTKVKLAKPKYSTLFDGIDYKNLDQSLLNFLKYLVNYGFYRFGLEICLLMSSIVIIVRMDAYAIFYGVWLGVLLRLKRKTTSKIWTGYLIFLLFILPIQYIFCLGLPPILCYEYPWSASNQVNPSNILNKIRLWLFLPDYSEPPISYQLIADFFQVFFVWLQAGVFQLEGTLESNDNDEETDELMTEFASKAGRNNELVDEVYAYRDNPYRDFVSETVTYFDKIKFGIYMYSYWFVLAIVYLTGTSRISLLCIGYVILSFFFLWLGQTFLMKPLDKLLKFWNILVFYCFLVIFIKACLQIVLCLLTGLVSDDIVCILIDVFGIDCRTLPGKKDLVTSACLKDGEKSEVGLVWDVFCFLVLILQRRLYMSYMFEHVVNEYKAQSTLAARGAEIFKEIINHKVEVERNKEIVILEKLKTNVERIRKHQSKECSYEPEEHYEALRSGDYYMFNAEFELDTTDITESEDDLMSTKKHHSSKSKQKKSSGKNSPLDEQSSSLKPIDSVDTRETPTTETCGEVVLRDPENEKTEKEKEAETTNRQSWLTIENKTMLSAFELFKKYSFIAIDFVIDYLNKHSKDYRQVSHILSKEKLILKREYGNTQTPSLLVLLKSAINREADEPPIQPLHELLAREDDAAKIIAAADEVDAEMNAQNRLNKFLSSIFYFTMSQSEFICYFFMILNHLNSASLLSVTLPISIFLWAMLCIPRPTKTFWITSITYIEAVVVIKYLFQFKLLPWNASQSASNENLIKVLSILGIQKQDNFAIYDLFALLVIFLHRTVLKRLGLWRDYLADDELLLASNEDEKKAQKKELAKINTNIYSEETGRSLAVEDSTEAPIANDENDQVDEENRDEEQRNEEEKEESDESDENGKDQEKMETKEENENETKVDLNELENSYNCLIDEELVQDPIEKEKLKERVKEKLQVAKKKRLVNPFIKFYNDMKTKHYAVVVDCYAKIFLCDFINCLITVFTYQYFGESARSAAKNTSSAISSIQDNKVPYSFLIMFLVQFILMIIDRALYLRKNRQGKFIFQVLLVLFVHVWVFFVLPYITKLNFVENSAAQVWYFVKCIYFGYSSRQIRCGYPTRILGNFLTKSYSYVNLVLFKGFLLVPFLLELRSLMDWMFTDTSLGLSDWLQMEDIYSNIFVLKCFRYNENKHPTPRGQKRQAIIKYGFGGVLLCIIILIIWFPLLLFSFSEGFNKSVPPQSCKIDIELSGFLPIYSMTSQQRQAQKYTKQMLDDFKKFAPEQSYSFLNDFTPDDVFCITIPGNSTSTWQISPPSLASLKDLLTDPDPIDFDFIYTITRESSEQKNVQLSEVVTATRELLLDNSNKSVILNLLNNNAAESNSSVLIKSAYPRYIHARPKGHILEIDSFKYSENFKYYVDVRMALRNSSNELWWDVYDDNNNDYMPPCSKPGYLSLIVFSDKVSPSSISFITEQGIIGIYITIVLALSRFLRIMVVNSSQRIMFEQLPNVDRVLKLCHSVYMVRENKQYILEEYLYAKIIFLYRSPEVMIRYTKNDHEKKNQ